MSGFLWTCALGAPVAPAAWLAARYAFGLSDRMSRALAAALLAWGWITFEMQILGVAGLIARGPLLVGSLLALLCGAGCLVAAKSRSPDDALDPVTDLESSGEATASARWGWTAVCAVALVTWAASTILVGSLLVGVKVVSDGPIYHLFFAAKWWRSGRLILIAAPFGESGATYFPANGNLWFCSLMTSWGGEQLAKVGQAPFFLLAGATAFALARRLGASREAAMIAATWFLALPPMLLFSFEPNVDTLFVSGYLLSCYFFYIYTQSVRYSTRACILAGLAAGLAWGTKATGVVFIPPLLLIQVVVIALRRGSRGRARALRDALALAAAAVAPVAYWMVRDAILTGNPLYPLHVTLFGRVLLAGWYDRAVMSTSPYYAALSDWRSVIDMVLVAVDGRFMPVWVIALAGGWAVATRRKPVDGWVWGVSALALVNFAIYLFAIPYRTQQRFMLQAFGLAVVPLARLFDRVPGGRAIGVALLGLHLLTGSAWPFGIRDSDIPWDLDARVPNATPAFLESPLGFLHNHDPATRDLALQRATTAAGLGFGAGMVAWVSMRLAPKGSRRKHDGAGGQDSSRRAISLAASCAIPCAAYLSYFLVVALLTTPLRLDDRLRFYPPFPDYFRAWLALDSRVGPAGSRIAYAGTDLPYYLLGVGLRNDVFYVNIDEHRDWLMHDYHAAALAANAQGDASLGPATWPTTRPGWDRIRPNFDAWLANLRAAGIRILFVTRANPAEGAYNLADPAGFPIERVWADAHPALFTPLYGNNGEDPLVRVYRVESSPTARD